jgi:hypothetical protein
VIIKIRDKNKKREREQQAAESGEEASPRSNANNHDVSPRSETVCNVQNLSFFQKKFRSPANYLSLEINFIVLIIFCFGKISPLLFSFLCG